MEEQVPRVAYACVRPLAGGQNND